MTVSNPVHAAPDLLTISQALFLDLSLATARQVWGIRPEKATAKTTWQSYDASVRAITTATGALYHTPFFSDVMSGTINQLLRWQYLRTAVSNVLWTNFWQRLGLPTAAEVQALDYHLRALEARLPLVVQNKSARAIRPQFHSAKFSMNGSASTKQRKGEAQKERAVA